jgi:hypothetical protein
MDFSWLVPLLSLITLLAVAVFAAVSKVDVEERMDDPSIPKSTLAVDGPFGGVGFLRPIDPGPRRIDRVDPVLE